MEAEEIKKIAKEFTIQVNGICDCMIEGMDDYQTAVALLHFLLNDYCIIPKSKMQKQGKRLISYLISALCGDEYQEASEIMEQIKATGDEELIRKAEYINSVL